MNNDLTSSEIIVAQAQKNADTSSKIVVSMAKAMGYRYTFKTWRGPVVLAKFYGSYYAL